MCRTVLLARQWVADRPVSRITMDSLRDGAVAGPAGGIQARSAPPACLWPLLLGALLALGATVLTPAPALAVTKTWVGGGTTGTGPTAWSNGFNWLPIGAPSAVDDLVFPAGGSVLTTNNDFAAGTVFNSITIQGSGYTLNGNAVTIAAGQ